MPKRASVPEGKALFSRIFPRPWRGDTAEGKALFYSSREEAGEEPRDEPAPGSPESEAPADGRGEPRGSPGAGDLVRSDAGQKAVVVQPLGPFMLVDELGKGGLGAVYHAQQSGVPRDVALKIVHSWLADQPGFSGALLRKLRAVARLRHPSIVTLHDVGESGGQHYIVTDLLEGRSLERIVRESGPLPPERALRIALQVAVALDYAHTAGIVHGDVKPANVVVGPDGRATLTDFGLADLAEATVRQTTSGVVLRDPAYMAPEQVDGQPGSSAIDRYAFAVLLFEMLAGSPPFKAASPIGVLVSQASQPPPAISGQQPGLPSALDEVFARALAKDPAARYATCSDLVLAAAAALGHREPARQTRRSGVWQLPLVRAAAPLVAVGLLVAALATTGALSQATDGLWERRAAGPASPLPTVVAPPGADATPTPGLTAPAAAPSIAGAATTTTPSTATPTASPTPVPPTATPAPSTPIAASSPAQPSSAPSGTLVFARRTAGGTNDLHLLPLATRSLAPLSAAGPGSAWAPAASPDGEWLAFAVGTAPRADIAVMRRDGSDRRIVARSGELDLGSPWWMPDGRIAFNGDRGEVSEIYAVAREGGELRQLTQTSGKIEGTRIPTWPHAGDSLGFTGRVGGAFRVFVQPEGGAPRAVSPAGAVAYAPAWSPDGSRIAFSGSLADGRVGIFSMAADGTDVRRVAAPASGTAACCPTWSFDGRWIAYVAGLGQGASPDHGDVYVVPAAGGEPVRLTSDGRTYSWRIAWLP